VSGELPPASGGLAAGSQIAGYRIEEQIGRGGMAVVYRAFDPRLNRTVALKILAPELADDAAFRKRFMREMRAAAAVDHPHIVPVFDAGEADGALFIAMRYVAGQDLRTLLDAEPRLPADRVVQFIAQAASALDEAHSRGLVHRDVKPGNMLLAAVDGRGQPDHLYLSDFGLSKPALASANLTLTGQFLGTLDYMAPEQVEGHAVDGRADLYSLACTAFEMLAGEPPFKRDVGMAVLWAQLSAPVPSLRALRPDLPPAVDPVIAKALAKAPGDRYQTCNQFATALREACGADAPAAAGPAVLPPGPPTERARVPAAHPAAAIPADVPADLPPGPVTGSADAPTDPGWRPAAPAAPRPVSAGRPPSAAPPGAWPPAPPPVTRPRGPAPPRRRSGPRVAATVACIALIVIAGVAIVILRGHHTTTSTPPVTPTTPASGGRTTTAAGPLGPAATVRAYFTAINNHAYGRAWSLGGKNTGSSYSAFVAGFDQTQSDNVTIVSVAGTVVTVTLAATQTDGSVNYYRGTYTVTQGVITQSQIEPAG